MYLLVAVINDEELLDELMTGWLDIGVTGATVVESTDLLQLISHHVPIFAGFRTLTSGGMTHNKTIFTAIDRRQILDQAVAYLEALFHDAGRPHMGMYCVLPLLRAGKLGLEVDPKQHRLHIEKKLGRAVKDASQP